MVAAWLRRLTLPDTPLLIALHRVGPYHRARFATLAARCPLVVVETRPNTLEYPWDSQEPNGYWLEQLTGHSGPDQDPSCSSLNRQFDGLIARYRPRCLVSVGWADRSYQRLLLAAHRHGIPLLLISDSRYEDGFRTPMGEFPKSLLLAGFSAALVAGRQSRAYLERLGYPSEAIFQPWDVVDNEAWQPDDSTSPLSNRQPPHWLCVSRFVEKKNHHNLLKAFGIYQKLGGTWGLQLIGEGPLEQDVHDWISTLPEPGMVKVLPFMQFTELRQCYHSARGLILASTSDQWGLVVNEAMAAGLPVLVSHACGCAFDLIDDGRTGFLLDPDDPAQIAGQLKRLESLSAVEISNLTNAAKASLSAFDSEAFATGILEADAWARSRPRFARRACLMAQLLSHRI